MKINKLGFVGIMLTCAGAMSASAENSETALNNDMIPFGEALDNAAIVQDAIPDVCNNSVLIGNGDINGLLNIIDGKVVIRLTKNDIGDWRHKSGPERAVVPFHTLRKQGKEGTVSEERIKHTTHSAAYPCPIPYARITVDPKELTPLSRKQVRFAKDGWIPIFQVSAVEGQVRYDVRFWATPLPDVKDWEKAFDWPTEGENFLIWITVKAVNLSDKASVAKVEVAPVPKEPSGKGKRNKREPKPRKDLGTYSWSWELEPNGSAEGVARYTFFRVDDPDKYKDEDAGIWLKRTEEFWRSLFVDAVDLKVPCRKATEAYMAVHVSQFIIRDHGEFRDGEGFYDRFYPRSGAYHMMEMEEAGLAEVAKRSLGPFLKNQTEDGRFYGSHINQSPQLDANGQVQWTLLQYYKIYRDRAWLEQVYPQMIRAARWTMRDRKKAPADSLFAGLVHAAPADGERLGHAGHGKQHHIVGYDFWNLRGMLCTAEAARILGKEDDAKELLADAEDYRAAIGRAHKNTGLKHFPPSWEKEGTHWGNTETLWPTELFDRDDPRVAELSRHVREEFGGGYIEGVIQWKGTSRIESIHPYMGAFTTMSDLIRGLHEQVVEDFYWYLLHSTSTHAFPEGIFYKTRTAWYNTIPHAQASSTYAFMFRHMLVHEQGEELHLLKAVPDWWLAEGEEIRVLRAPTHFGEMNLVVTGKKDGVEVKLDLPKRNPPKKVILTLPKSRPLIGSVEGVEVVERDEQTKRWDFPIVVEAYKKMRGDKRRALPASVGERQEVIPFYERLEYAGVAASDPENHVWGCSPVKCEKGLYHLFGARFKTPFEPGWRTDSHIVRFVSDTPRGPFTMAEVVYRGEPDKPRAWNYFGISNPCIKKVDDKYALFFIGRPKSMRPQTIGMMVADTVEGPWSEPVNILRPSEDPKNWTYQSGSVCNPAFVRFKDKYYLYYKSKNARYGVAVADRLEGPYVHHPTPITKTDKTIEFLLRKPCFSDIED